MLAYFRRSFVYDEWANREILAFLSRTPDPPPRAVRFLAHIVAAEWLWFSRLREQPSPHAVWPDMTLDEARDAFDKLGPQLRTYLAELTADDLSRRVAYINSAGESWTNSVGDILTHVLVHSAYHRGQIATEVRAANIVPAYTDFIHCVRQGYLQ